IIIKYEVVQALATPPILRMAYEKWSKSDQQQFRIKMQQTADGLSDSLRKFGLSEFMTDKEVKFFSTHPLDLTQQQIVNASWRMESVMAFMWALGIIPELLPFDHQSQHELMRHIPHENISDFFISAKLLDEEKIEKGRSLSELWHWRSRTRELIEEKRPFPAEIPQFKSYDEIVRLSAKAANEKDSLEIIDEDFAALGKAYRDLTDEEWSSIRSIAVERHFALNWLCGYAPDNRWDETPTDT
ncbi:MAG: hypothetical protein QOD03_1642, partial [Verrucomicrobiota bacterium]